MATRLKLLPLKDSGVGLWPSLTLDVMSGWRGGESGRRPGCKVTCHNACGLALNDTMEWIPFE